MRHWVNTTQLLYIFNCLYESILLSFTNMSQNDVNVDRVTAGDLEQPHLLRQQLQDAL